MAFAEKLKAYLSNVGELIVKDDQTTRFIPSPTWSRSAVVRCLERVEAIAPSGGPEGPARPKTLGGVPRREQLPELLRQWQDRDRSVRFAQTLAGLLQASFLVGATRDQIEQAIQTALARWLSLPDSLGSAVRDAELDRLTNLAWLTVFQPNNDDPTAPETYAREINATRGKEPADELTAIGRVILELTGRDLVQWLLSVEAASSTGPGDDWRLSRTAAEVILKTPRRVEYEHVWEDGAGLGFSWQTMRRMGDLGVVDYIVDSDDQYGHVPASGYELTAFGEPLLRSLVSETDTPFSVLAKTLTQDLATSTLSRTGGGLAGYSGALASVEATALQARFFAHEIRNALPPAQVALESMLDELRGSGAAATIERYVPRISGGIARVFAVVKQMQQLTELATQPPERFDLLSAVRDGVSEVLGLNGTSITLEAPAGPLPAVMGYRSRFVMAVMNMLHNAQQIHAKKVLIASSVSDDGALVSLNIDDDGPGVPTEQRRAIFEQGVSLREGGSGQGLALVREVIEREMRGRVECMPSPLGGARFHIELPVGSEGDR